MAPAKGKARAKGKPEAQGNPQAQGSPQADGNPQPADNPQTEGHPLDRVEYHGLVVARWERDAPEGKHYLHARILYTDGLVDISWTDKDGVALPMLDGVRVAGGQARKEAQDAVFWFEPVASGHKNEFGELDDPYVWTREGREGKLVIKRQSMVSEKDAVGRNAFSIKYRNSSSYIPRSLDQMPESMPTEASKGKTGPSEMVQMPEMKPPAMSRNQARKERTALYARRNAQTFGYHSAGGSTTKSGSIEEEGQRVQNTGEPHTLPTSDEVVSDEPVVVESSTPASRAQSDGSMVDGAGDQAPTEDTTPLPASEDTVMGEGEEAALRESAVAALMRMSSDVRDDETISVSSGGETVLDEDCMAYSGVDVYMGSLPVWRS